MALKYSRQREIIRNFMQGRTDHPTADVVYMNVRKEIPNISLGTVYRNLMLLVQMGELLKVEVGDGTVHFDPLTDDHAHLICNTCGKVEDLMLSVDEAMKQEAEHLSGGTVDGYTLTFTGTCAACRAADKETARPLIQARS
ncbi:MAG: transcriptional repressor [Lachnospiraceae bacterium]|nr:transcriptional repressor [Lachnospiraceae bacterium]